MDSKIEPEICLSARIFTLDIKIGGCPSPWDERWSEDVSFQYGKGQMVRWGEVLEHFLLRMKDVYRVMSYGMSGVWQIYFPAHITTVRVTHRIEKAIQRALNMWKALPLDAPEDS